MENFISVLEQLVPVIIIVTLTVFMTLETWVPYFKHSTYRKKQRWHNVGNLTFSFVLNAALSGVIAYAITTATNQQFGLLYKLHIPTTISLVVGIFLCDLNGYVAHRLYHKIPLFWRFHRVHHSSYLPETDSNFSDVFTIWDRLFNTHKTRKAEDITFGLEEMRDPKSQTFWGLLKTPFEKL